MLHSQILTGVCFKLCSAVGVKHVQQRAEVNLTDILKPRNRARESFGWLVVISSEMSTAEITATKMKVTVDRTAAEFYG